MSTYAYSLDNFIATPTGTDVRLKIYNKNNIIVFDVEPEFAYVYQKNNLVIIKVKHQNDIPLSFADETTAISAMHKFNTMKQMILDRMAIQNMYYTIYQIQTSGQSLINWFNIFNVPGYMWTSADTIAYGDAHWSSSALTNDVWVYGSGLYGAQTDDTGTNASGDYSVAEGSGTTASGNASHAEGGHTVSSGDYSHAQGAYNTTNAIYSHIAGHNNILTDTASGSTITALSGYTGTEPYTLYVQNLRVLGNANIHQLSGDTLPGGLDKQIQINYQGQNIIGSPYLIFDYDTTAFTFGTRSGAIGIFSSVHGVDLAAVSAYTHAEGYQNIASGEASHAEGSLNEASGNYSHAEGRDTLASGQASHSEGYRNITNAIYSHIAGHNNVLTDTASGSTMTAISGYTGTEPYTLYVHNLRVLGNANIHQLSGDTLPGGLDTQIQFNNQGNNLDGSPTFTYDYTNTALTFGIRVGTAGQFSIVAGSGVTASGFASYVQGAFNISNADMSYVGGYYNLLTTGSTGSAMLAISGYTGTSAWTLYAQNLEIIGNAHIGSITNLVISSATPTSPSDTLGVVGMVAWDTNYFYIKTTYGWTRQVLNYGW
jgi:hypothetical protein